MGRRGDGGNVLLIAREAVGNPNMRPRRRREVGLQALDCLWGLHAPAPGTRLQAFRVAFRKVQAAAEEHRNRRRRSASGPTRYGFTVDDRDDFTPW